MTESNYKIVTMTRDQVDTAVGWAMREGWNPGLHDSSCYYQADPEGFLLGLLDDKPIATISAVRYGDHFGFLGFYIVEPEFRGQGYGIQIWEKALDRLSGRTIGLDGVVEQQPNYQKSGFELAHRNIRFRGNLEDKAFDDPCVVPLAEFSFSELLQYDEPFFATSRPAFLKNWISQPGCHAIGYRLDNKLAGYAVMRRCRSGYKIAPLCADSPEIAEALFQALLAKADTSEPVFLDVPEVNAEAMKLVRRHQMQPEFETARMYRGTRPDLDLDRLYGVTSFEIG